MKFLAKFCYGITGQTVILCYSFDQQRRVWKRIPARQERVIMDEAVTQFLQFLTVEKGASQNTVAAYRNDIQQFAAFAGGGRQGPKRTSWTQIDRLRIQEYMRNLQTR